MTNLDSGGGEPDPPAVLAAFGLPGPVRAMVRVPGAWSNRVWRLTTGSRAYAVKQLLNPFGEPRWRERLAEACSYEQIACAAGVSMPEPMPNPADGGCLADVPTVSASAAVPVRVHRWVDGVAPGDRPVGAEVAAWAGGTLATLHRLDVRAVDRTLFPVLGQAGDQVWRQRIVAARQLDRAWTGTLERLPFYISRVDTLAREAMAEPAREVMSHADVDQKNLLLARDGPVLCDWDVAYPVRPRSELADCALSMGAWEDLAVARTVLRAYADADGPAGLGMRPLDLAGPLRSSLDWIGLNVDRALLPGDESAGLADSLLPRLLAELPRQLRLAERLSELLR